MTFALLAAPAAAKPPGTMTAFSTGFRPIPVQGCAQNECSNPADITAGPDGNLWFIDSGYVYGRYSSIGRITPSGSITEFGEGLDGHPDHCAPGKITSGSDGNVWFTYPCPNNPAIGRITPLGAITLFTAGLTPSSVPNDITQGPDGNVWFVDSGSVPAIGRITPSGAITEFSAGLGPDIKSFGGITKGSDANLWFTEKGSRPVGGSGGGGASFASIGRITPAGSITEYGFGDNNSDPGGITLGSDGNIWFNDTGAVGKVTPGGVVSEYSVGRTLGDDISLGPDGNVWVPTDSGGALGRITMSGSVTTFDGVEPEATTTGPDGNLWFTRGPTSSLVPSPAVGRIVLAAPPGGHGNAPGCTRAKAKLKKATMALKEAKKAHSIAKVKKAKAKVKRAKAKVKKACGP